MIRSNIKRRKVTRTQVNGAPAYSGGWSGGGGSASLPDLTNLQYVPYDIDNTDFWLIPDRKVKSDLGFVGNLEGSLNGRNDQYHPGNSNKSTISWSMAEALVYDKISFSKYGNAEGGYDGASIRHDNEGNTDASKLIFELSDDPNDWFEWRIWNAYNTFYHTPLVVRHDMCYVNGKFGVNTNNPTDAFHVVGDTRTSGTYYGNNSEITGKSKAAEGEFNNLKVHGNLEVYELIANQTRVTNGDLWVQNSYKLTNLYYDSVTEFSFDIDYHSLKVDDLCIIQVKRKSGTVSRVAFKVVGYDISFPIPYQAVLISGSIVDNAYNYLFFDGDLVVQVGNTTNTARQSSVLNCVSFGGYGAATLYYAGVNSIPVGSFYPDNSKITSAIGDLRALGLGSAATYTTDGHFRGTVQADSGRVNGCLNVGSDDLVGITGRNLGADPTFQPSFFAGISELDAYHALEGDYGGFEEIPFSVIGKRGYSVFSNSKMRRCTSEDMYVTGSYRRSTYVLMCDNTGVYLHGSKIGANTINMSNSSDYTALLHNGADISGGVYFQESTDQALKSGLVQTLTVVNSDRGSHIFQPKVRRSDGSVITIANVPSVTLQQFETYSITVKYAHELRLAGYSGWVVISLQKFSN